MASPPGGGAVNTTRPIFFNLETSFRSKFDVEGSMLDVQLFES